MRVFQNRKFNIKSVYIAGAILASFAFCFLIFHFSILSAVALEQDVRCGMEEHVHSDDCYDGDFLVCGKTAHTHDGNCYLVLLQDNDINSVLSMISQNEERSLEYAINEETPSTLALNNNINAISTMAEEDVENGGISATAIDATPEKSNYKANFYIYLDGKWTCIGTLDFETTRIWGSYNSTIATSEVLNLVNTTLGTTFAYDSFDIAVASSESGTYSNTNLGVGATTTTIAYWQNQNNARSTKYIRLIPSNGSVNSTAFAFYTVTFVYPDGSVATRYIRRNTTVVLPSGNYEWTNGDQTYAAGQAVTITNTTTFQGALLGPVTLVNINYDIGFPTVSGVTVNTKPTLAGLSTGTVTDGYTEGSSAVIRNVSQQMVEGKVNDNSTNLSRVVQFKGWRVGNTDTILQPNTTLVWEELLQYATGASMQLTGVWEYDAVRTASFFIRFDSVAVDTGGNVTGQDQNLYTDELFSSYVGGIDTSLSVSQLHDKYHIVDTTSDNSYGADQAIRALYGEKSDGVWLSALPSDDYIFASLAEYARTGYLSVDGEPVKVEDLNHNAYAIRWYVFKCQSDAWHIDGKLVKKEGLIHVYKTFAGNKELIALAKEGFYIDAYNQADNVHTRLDMNNYISYDAAKEKYMWEISEVDYGEMWTITEHPTALAGQAIDFHTHSEYNVMDAHGDQSIIGTGTSLEVSGMTYALDEGTDEVLRAEFTNIYNKKNSIVIKKQDSRTGMSIGGATFQLLQNGKILKFQYDSVAGSYQYDQTNGQHTILNGNANGYFEIAIEDFSYDEGPITIREISPPQGYAPIGDVQIGYMNGSQSVGILSGNSELIQYTNGILIVGNSTDVCTVTAKKNWDCPQSEWQDVTMQLLANGKLVTTVIAGVDAQVVLNADNQWTYTWNNLPVYVNGEKIVWSLKEIQIGTETCKADGSFVNWLASYELPVYGTDANGKETVLLTVTNTTKRVMLRLTKMDLRKTMQLAGATFLLEVVDANGNVITTEIAKTATTGDAGTLVFDNLKCGVRYRLTEITAPNGYHVIDEYIYFTINEDGSVSVEDNYYAEAGGTAYNLIVRNAEAIPLPESGGTGTSMLIALSMLCVIMCIGVYIKQSYKIKEYEQ